jgi:succinate-acetate transporter protein
MECRSWLTGILLMQKGEKDTYPFKAFLSFQDSWHAYAPATLLMHCSQREKVEEGCVDQSGDAGSRLFLSLSDQ